MNPLRSFLAAVAFLTVLPVGFCQMGRAELRRSLAFFPLVGVLLGAVLAAVAWLIPQGTPPSLAGVALAALLAILTGGLHLDGLADVFDGLGGGRGDRERMLAIMHDSRIGAHGAAALILVLAGKIFALAAAWQISAWQTMVSFPAFARWAVVPLVVWFPSARPEGLGGSFRGTVGIWSVVVASAWVAAVAIWGGAGLLFPAAAALAATLLFGGYICARLGGLTGDVYGAAIELAELAFLAATAAGS